MRVGLVSGDWVHPKYTPDGKARWGGSGWVRLAQYMGITDAEWVPGTLIWNRDHFAVQDADNNLHFVPIIYMHRLMHTGLVEHIYEARANGQVIINDIDDWYWGLDTTNDAWKATHPKYNKTENIGNYRKILSASDLVTVSTPYLLDKLTWVKCPKQLVKNTVDVGRFTSVVHTDKERPIVGWTGSTAHRSRDLETIAGIIPPLYRNGEILLQHSGDHISFPSFASKIGVRNEDVITLPLSDQDAYPSILNFDIGIVPLRKIPFNQSKSYIKGLEYSAAGIPFVAQEIDPYIDLLSSFGIGRLADKAKSWQKHIRALYDYRVRQEEADRQRELVKQADISVGAQQINDILRSF